MSARCDVCGEEHGPDNPIRESEYKRHGLLVVDPATRPAVSDEELAANLLTEEEFDAIIEREQAWSEGGSDGRQDATHDPGSG